jgi:hypothetical protein
MSNKPTLTICILAKLEICAVTTSCVSNLKNFTPLTDFYNINVELSIGQSDLPKVRSNNLTKWYDNGAKNGDVFMFLDSDQTFSPVDIIQGLHYLKQYDVSCGAYAKRTAGITAEPKYLIDFYNKNEGELWYGATGFMMIRYNIVDRLVKHLNKKYMTGKDVLAYDFFFERLVKEFDLDIWLSEDYSFCWLVRSVGGSVYGYISPTLGHIVSTEKFVTIPNSTKWSDKSIVYYCHASFEKWSPDSIHKGIGGSETAVIKLAPYWVKAGYEVTVYCPCDKTGIYDGVTYKDVADFCPYDIFNILIVWRTCKILDTTDLRAKLRIIDLHDEIFEKITERLVDFTDIFCVKSKFQSLHLPENKVRIIPNGGAYEYNFTNNKKDPNYIIYSSSYDRGLHYMLKWGWPKIKKECPDAYLKIFYGWNSYDSCKGDVEFKNLCTELMNQDGIIHCGRVSQEDLAIEKSKANIHYYVGNFQEIDCITVRESAYLGVIPVVSKSVPVFEEKDYCILIDGDPTCKETQEKAADKIIKLLKNEDLANDIRYNMKIPKDETWEKTADKWLELFKNKARDYI